MSKKSKSPKKGDPFAQAAEWNHAHPVGTPVRYWPGPKEGPGIESMTRSVAWVVGDHEALVQVEGRAGGIALTHIEVLSGDPGEWDQTG